MYGFEKLKDKQVISVNEVIMDGLMACDWLALVFEETVYLIFVTQECVKVEELSEISKLDFWVSEEVPKDSVFEVGDSIQDIDFKKVSRINLLQDSNFERPYYVRLFNDNNLIIGLELGVDEIIKGTEKSLDLIKGFLVHYEELEI